MQQTGQPYQYASGDPVTSVDPSGLCPYISSNPKQTRCRTDLLLWRWNTILNTFQHYRILVCGRSQAPCNNHGNSHGKWLDWSSDGCSGGAPQNPEGFPFWKACERHDFGHRNYVDQGRCNNTWYKNNLATNFYWDMRGGICNHEFILVRGECDRWAAVYYEVVHHGHC